jgi:hypothetical protein
MRGNIRAYAISSIQQKTEQAYIPVLQEFLYRLIIILPARSYMHK